MDDDSKLAIRMAERTVKEGVTIVPGNRLGKKPNALYPLDPAFAEKGKTQARSFGVAPNEGRSFGAYGSTAVAGGRPAMTVITIEVQTSKPSLMPVKPGDPPAKRDDARLKELQAHSIALEEVFLGPP